MPSLSPGDLIAIAGVVSLFILALLGALGTLILKTGSHGAKLDSLLVSLPNLISSSGEHGAKIDGLVTSVRAVHDRLDRVKSELKDADTAVITELHTFRNNLEASLLEQDIPVKLNRFKLSNGEE